MTTDWTALTIENMAGQKTSCVHLPDWVKEVVLHCLDGILDTSDFANELSKCTWDDENKVFYVYHMGCEKCPRFAETNFELLSLEQQSAINLHINGCLSVVARRLRAWMPSAELIIDTSDSGIIYGAILRRR